MSGYGSYYHYKEPVLDWSVFYVVAVVASYVGIVVLALCVASGLFYLAELAEEYTTTAKRVLRWSILVSAVLHVLLLVVDQVSWWRSVLSICALGCYHQLLATFPWVVLNSVVSNAAVAAFVVDNASWYSFFIVQTAEFPFWSIVSYFVAMVWFVPVGLFVSLAISEDRMPGGAGVLGGSGGTSHGVMGGKGSRRSIASLMSFLTGKER